MFKFYLKPKISKKYRNQWRLCLMQQLLNIWTSYFNLDIFFFFFTKYYLKLTIKLFVCLCVTSWHNFRALPDRFDILFHHYLPPIYPARLVSGALLFIGVIHQEKEENQEAKEIQEVGDLKLP